MPGLCSVAIRNYPLMHLGSKTWEPDVVFHENDIVTFCGSSYQAIKDTMRVPITQDWRCIPLAATMAATSTSAAPLTQLLLIGFSTSSRSTTAGSSLSGTIQSVSPLRLAVWSGWETRT